MKKATITISIDGKEYPCRPTMGAMLRFKEQTGKDISEISGGVTDMATYLWCCIRSACKRDGVKFGMSLMDFADAVTQDDMSAWADALNAEAGVDVDEDNTEESKKK